MCFFRKNLLITAAVFLVAASAAFAQSDTAPAEETELYMDTMFAEYLVLEKAVLEGGAASDEIIKKIEELALKASGFNRKDIESRALMLLFIASERLKADIAEIELPVRSAILLESEAYRQTAENAAAFKSGLPGGIAAASAVSGVILLASAILENEMYRRYADAEIADHAAFYLYWYKAGKTAKAVSWIGAAAGFLAAGLLAALF